MDGKQLTSKSGAVGTSGYDALAAAGVKAFLAHERGEDLTPDEVNRPNALEERIAAKCPVTIAAIKKAANNEKKNPTQAGQNQSLKAKMAKALNTTHANTTKNTDLVVLGVPVDEKSTTSYSDPTDSSDESDDDMAPGKKTLPQPIETTKFKVVLTNGPQNGDSFLKMTEAPAPAPEPTPEPAPEAAPEITPEVKGPICGNPNCREFGHVLGFCPVPVDMEHGIMAGCFFCNTIDHDVDECIMMQGVIAVSLVNYLIASRAGLPPWKTRIDWVALAIDNWDIVNFTSLPLTRQYVKKWYIPHRAWLQSPSWLDRRSPFTDPSLATADRATLKAMSNRVTLRPLNEAWPDFCYCAPLLVDHLPLLKNRFLQKYIPAHLDTHVGAHAVIKPDGTLVESDDFNRGFAAGAAAAGGIAGLVQRGNTITTTAHLQTSAAAAAALDVDTTTAGQSTLFAAPKQQPKDTKGKKKLGRRAAKKALAEEESEVMQDGPSSSAAAAAANQPGPSTSASTSTTPAGPSTAPVAPAAAFTAAIAHYCVSQDNGHAAIVSGYDSDDDQNPLSEQMPGLLDKFDEMFDL